MAFTDRINERRKTYKNIGDGDDVRRRREVETVQIRKKDKEVQLAQRRKLIELSSDITGSTVCFGSLPICASSIPKLASALTSGDPMVVAEASIAIRKILSVDRTPPIEEVLQVGGVLERMCELLADFRYPNIQLETCWSLTNIASGSREQTTAVVDSGVVPLIVNLLQSDNEDLQEQAVWAIANIAGDRTEYRDGCIAAGTLTALCGIVEKALRDSKVQLLRLSVWGLSNMFRGGSGIADSVLKPSLPILARVLLSSNDTEVLADSAWALSYLTTGGSLSFLVSYIPLARLVSLLAHPSSSVHVPVLRVVGNLLSGDSAQEILENKTLLLHLKNLIGSHKKSIRKEALWAVSNICADSRENLQTVIDYSGLLEIVFDIARTASMDLRVEAIWSVCNACVIGSRSQLERIEEQFGIVTCLCAFLESAKDTRSLKTVLDAIYCLLISAQNSDTLDNFTATIEECGGMQKIEDLQHDESEEVYESCVKILEKFFSDNEQENVVFDFSAAKSSRLLVPRDSDVARSG